MNERIKELHGQAYLYALHNETKAREGGSHEPGTFNNDYREKFAELIAKEYIENCRDMFIVGSVSWNLLNEKLEHFGVE